ncbi:hypothetical protein ZIOFF_061744 [Zingiber officinale]|uniref:Uncharacterized protein n=1 Tax=Zingiber officinale TaxID=94328 RepID=A0A8J5EZU1_ZINOF|nr:hypothetical protein ZIOFF_061744 [Zingiber officinale]
MEETAVDEHRLADHQGCLVSSQESNDYRSARPQGSDPGTESLPEFLFYPREGLGDALEGVSRRIEAGVQALPCYAGAVPEGPTLELVEASTGDVAEVALGVHDFMVPVENVEGASGARSPELEAVEVVEKAELIVTAVEDVADLDGDDIPAGPASGGGVDEAGEREGLEGLVEISVKVSDGDEAGRGGDAGGGGGFRIRTRVKVDSEENAGN